MFPDVRALCCVVLKAHTAATEGPACFLLTILHRLRNAEEGEVMKP